MKDYYQIRVANPDDKKSILNLLNKVFTGQQHFNWERDEKYWYWKYELNVFGKAIIHVIEHNSDIIGSGVLWPWKLIARGEVFQVHQPCDTIIHPAYQGKGLFSLLIKHRIQSLRKLNTPFVFNFPNKNSLPAYLKFGWHYMTKLPWMLKVLNPARTFMSLTSKEKSNPLPLKPEDRINAQSCAEIFDESVYSKKYISTYRDNGFFEWRYKQHPYFHYGQVIAENNRKKAGAIYSINHKGKSREMIVVDLIGNPMITSRLFDQIQIKAKEYHVDFIVAVANSYYNTNILWKKGFLKVNNKNMVIMPFDIRIEDKISKFQNWDFIASMHDSV